MRQRGLVAVIEDLAACVEDSSEHLLADANLRSGILQRDRIASTQAGDVTEREQQSFLIAKADDFGFGESLWATMDAAQRRLGQENRRRRSSNRSAESLGRSVRPG